MKIMTYMKEHLVLPGESFIQEYKSVPPEGREALKDYAREEMKHKGIEIDGDIKFDQDVQESIDTWNETIDQIML